MYVFSKKKNFRFIWFIFSVIRDQSVMIGRMIREMSVPTCVMMFISFLILLYSLSRLTNVRIDTYRNVETNSSIVHY